MDDEADDMDDDIPAADDDIAELMELDIIELEDVAELEDFIICIFMRISICRMRSISLMLRVRYFCCIWMIF